MSPHQCIKTLKSDNISSSNFQPYFEQSLTSTPGIEVAHYEELGQSDVVIQI